MKIKLIILTLLCVSNNLFSMDNEKEKLDKQGLDLVDIKESLKNCFSQITPIIPIHNIISAYLKEWVEVKNFKDSHAFRVVLKYSPDGKRLILGSRDLSIFKTDKYEISDTFNISPFYFVGSISYSPDNENIALDLGLYIKIFNANGSKLLHSFIGHNDGIGAVEYSLDNKYLASCGLDATIKIWDRHDYKLLHTLTDHTGFVTSLSFSPNGKYLASAGEDKTFKIWDTNNFKVLCSKKVVLNGFPAHSIRFSSDSKYLAYSDPDDYSVRIRNCDDNYKLLHILRGHKKIVNFLAYSADNRYFVSASKDCILIWDALTYKRLNKFEGYDFLVTSIEFAPDNSKWLAAAYINGTVKIWHYQEIEEILQTRANEDTKKEKDLSSKENKPMRQCVIC